jgi:hypothetical protein
MAIKDDGTWYRSGCTIVFFENGKSRLLPSGIRRRIKDEKFFCPKINEAA